MKVLAILIVFALVFVLVVKYLENRSLFFQSESRLREGLIQFLEKHGV